MQPRRGPHGDRRRRLGRCGRRRRESCGGRRRSGGRCLRGRRGCRGGCGRLGGRRGCGDCGGGFRRRLGVLGDLVAAAGCDDQHSNCRCGCANAGAAISQSYRHRHLAACEPTSGCRPRWADTDQSQRPDAHDALRRAFRNAAPRPIWLGGRGYEGDRAMRCHDPVIAASKRLTGQKQDHGSCRP